MPASRKHRTPAGPRGGVPKAEYENEDIYYRWLHKTCADILAAAGWGESIAYLPSPHWDGKCKICGLEWKERDGTQIVKFVFNETIYPLLDRYPLDHRHGGCVHSFSHSDSVTDTLARHHEVVVEDERDPCESHQPLIRDLRDIGIVNAKHERHLNGFHNRSNNNNKVKFFSPVSSDDERPLWSKRKKKYTPLPPTCKPPANLKKRRDDDDRPNDDDVDGLIQTLASTLGKLFIAARN
jgi:hypothetical protein